MKCDRICAAPDKTKCVQAIRYALVLQISFGKYILKSSSLFLLAFKSFIAAVFFALQPFLISVFLAKTNKQSGNNIDLLLLKGKNLKKYSSIFYKSETKQLGW
jgi:hypothetical protein